MLQDICSLLASAVWDAQQELLIFQQHLAATENNCNRSDGQCRLLAGKAGSAQQCWLSVLLQGSACSSPTPGYRNSNTQQPSGLLLGARLIFLELFFSCRWKLLAVGQYYSWSDAVCSPLGVPVGTAPVNFSSCPRRESVTRSKEVPTALCSSSVRGWSGLGCFPPFAVAATMSWIGLCKDQTAPGSAQNPTKTRMCQVPNGRNPCFPAPEPGCRISVWISFSVKM